MTDKVTTETRSRIMSAIRAKNTKPEMAVRKFLHAKGLRFRLHTRNMPGRPDIVLPKYMVAIFVHGCFWHGHQDCYKPPKSNVGFWSSKIERNIERDARKNRELEAAGWKVLTIWECDIPEGLPKLYKTIVKSNISQR